MTEKKLNTYDPSQYRTPDGVPADIVIFTITSQERNTVTPSLPIRELKVLLIKRGNNPDDPYKNMWALPGGFSNENESLLETAKRELKEETHIEDVHIEHLGVYSKPGRDSRGWIISSAYFALVNEQHLKTRKADSDAQEVGLFTLDEISNMQLAFDHLEIMNDAVKEIRDKIHYTDIAKEFLQEEFTLSELAQVIHVVDPSFDEKKKANFSRSLTKTKKREGIIERVMVNGVQKETNRNSRNPAELFRFTGYVPKLSIYY